MACPSASSTSRSTSPSLSPLDAVTSMLCVLAGSEILRRDAHHAVGIDREGDFDLGNAARAAGGIPTNSNRPSVMLSSAISRSPCKHMDAHDVLMILGGRKDLALRAGDRRVLLENLGCHTALCLHAQRERRHVEQQDLVDLAGQHAALNRRARRRRPRPDSHPSSALDRKFLRPCAAPSAFASCRRRVRPRRVRSPRGPHLQARDDKALRVARPCRRPWFRVPRVPSNARDAWDPLRPHR